MTPARMAEIHAASFTVPRPWSEGEFREILGDSLTLVVTVENMGFGLVRLVNGEAELLTIAVLPQARNQGLGTAILAELFAVTRARGGKEIFLEVAADNLGAIRLYHRSGFSQVARRADYYGVDHAAEIWRKDLTHADV